MERELRALVVVVVVVHASTSASGELGDARGVLLGRRGGEAAQRPQRQGQVLPSLPQQGGCPGLEDGGRERRRCGFRGEGKRRCRL